MGRRKIEIKPITDERNRSVTFLKRKGGLFKKAHELAVLCQVELALVVITPDRKVHEYCTSPRVEDIVRSCQKYPVVEHKGLQDYSGRYAGAPGHDADEEGHEEANIEDSEVEPEEVHIKEEGERPEATRRQILDDEHVDRQASISESRPGSRPRLKVQIPQIPPPAVTPEPQKPLKQDNDVGADLSRAQQAASVASQRQPPGTHAAQQVPHDGARSNDSEPVNGASPNQLLDADKVAQARASARQPQHPQVTFPSRFKPSLNRGGLPQSPSGFVPQGYPPYVPYTGYFNNYPMGYGYPAAPPSAMPGGASQSSAEQAGAPPRGNPTGPGPGPGPGPASAAASAALNPGPPPPVGGGGQRMAGASATAGSSAGGGRWSAYPQSPMTYFVPAPMSGGGDTSQSKLEPGAISAAMPSRYMNEMLASPSNYFSMEWGVWDPQASAGPGGTARISPSSLPNQASNGANSGEMPMASPLQFVPAPENERKRVVTEDNMKHGSKWRPKG